MENVGTGMISFGVYGNGCTTQNILKTTKLYNLGELCGMWLSQSFLKVAIGFSTLCLSNSMMNIGGHCWS